MAIFERTIGIPLSCPKCGGQLVSISYDAPIKILKHRSWHICRQCNFERNVDEFKNALLTV